MVSSGLKDEYLSLYRRVSGREIDMHNLDLMNAELYSSLHRLISTCDRPIPQDVYIGLLPATKINACVHTRSSGYLFVINDGLISLIGGVSLLLGGILPCSFQGQTLDPDIDMATARDKFNEMLTTFVKHLKITFDGAFVRPTFRQEFSQLVCTSVIWYVVAHELAHVVCGHLKEDNLEELRLGTSIGQSYVTSWQDEMEADKEAIRMLLKLHQGNAPVDTAFLGPIVLFELLESISQIALKSGFPQLPSHHPPPKARRSALIQDNYSPGQIPQTPFLDHVVETIHELRRKS